MTSKILVTGTAGFIGTQLAKKLAESGFNVLGIDLRVPDDERIAARTEVIDLLDSEALLKCVSSFAPRYVVHLAARTDLDEEKDIYGYASNFIGTTNLMQAIDSTPEVERVLFTSSQLVCEVGHIPTSPDEYCPSNLYGESKVEMEKRILAASPSTYEWYILRPTTIWGEGMSAHYQSFLRTLERGFYFHFGDSPLHKSYGYVGNTVHQILKFLEAPMEAIHGKTFYLADYEPLSLRSWTEALASQLNVAKPRTFPLAIARIAARLGDAAAKVNVPVPFNSFRLNNILTEYVFDLEPTRKICGDPLPFSIDAGVTRTINWYRTLSDTVA